MKDMEQIPEPKTKIRVIHMITKLELGGAQINTIYTYENLNKTKFEVFLLCGPKGILTDKVKKRERIIIIKDLIRKINPYKDFKALIQTLKTLKRIRPHIVHTHSAKAGIIGRISAFFLKIPVTIHSVHGFSFSSYQFFLKRNFFLIAEKCAAKLTTHFVFVAKDDIKIAKKKGLIRKNFSLIRSGFPIKKFKERELDLDSVREKYGISKQDFVCGIIAPFKPQKGLFHLTKIASEVINKRKNVVFFIAGDGELRKKIESELRRNKIMDNFRLPGFIFDIERVIDVFDVGVSTALWEGLPQSIVQMRLKKVPVIASDIPGNREVIKDNKNGFLEDVFDYKKFAEKILYLINRKDERERLANFDEDFSMWDADFMVKAQEDLYLSLL